MKRQIEYWLVVLYAQPVVTVPVLLIPLATRIVPAMEPGVLKSLGLLLMVLQIFVSVASLVVTPLFPLALFWDARYLRRNFETWQPNEYIWGLFGLLQLFGPVPSRISAADITGIPYSQYSAIGVVAVGTVWYLYRRRQAFAESGN